MDRKLVLYLLGAAALGFVGIMMMMPEEPRDGVVRLPWKITIDHQGRTQVFGLTIGATRLAEVRDVFGEDGKINLFSRKDRADRYSAEAYFDHIYLSGLRADFVFTIGADQSDLQAMFERGLRISQLGSGDKKVKLSPTDIESLLQRPIEAITYLPWKSLDADILRRRFGQPEQILEEATGVSHWLYPQQGMDIALAKDGGVVIQYVNPAQFQALTEPIGEAPKASAPDLSGHGIQR